MIEVYATTSPIDGPGCANEEGVVAKFVVFSQEFEHSRDTAPPTKPMMGCEVDYHAGLDTV